MTSFVTCLYRAAVIKINEYNCRTFLHSYNIQSVNNCRHFKRPRYVVTQNINRMTITKLDVFKPCGPPTGPDCTEYHIHQQIYIHRPNFVAQAKLFLCCLDYGEMEVHPPPCSTPPPNISCRKLVLCSGLFFPGGRTPFIPRASTAPKNRDVLSSLRIEPRFISVRG